MESKFQNVFFFGWVKIDLRGCKIDFITFKCFKRELVLLVELIVFEVRICLCLEYFLRMISCVPEHVQHEIREATKCSLFNVFCPHSHVFWKTFQKVICPKIDTSQVHLTVEFLWFGLPKRRCILLI